MMVQVHGRTKNKLSLLWLTTHYRLFCFLFLKKRSLGTLGKQMSFPGSSEKPIVPVFKFQPEALPHLLCTQGEAAQWLQGSMLWGAPCRHNDWMVSFCGRRSLRKINTKPIWQAINRLPLYAKHLYQAEIRGLGALWGQKSGEEGALRGLMFTRWPYLAK